MEPAVVISVAPLMFIVCEGDLTWKQRTLSNNSDKSRVRCDSWDWSEGW